MGTRGSPLALAQSRQVARALEAAHSGLRVEECVIRTTGDKQQGQPLPVIGGKVSSLWKSKCAARW
jgi:hydroxymethylbilane synthase